MFFFFFFSSRRRHTRLQGDWSSDVCSSDLRAASTSCTPFVGAPSSVADCSAFTSIRDRKSTRLNSSHLVISYAVFCLKKKKSDRHHLSYTQYILHLIELLSLPRRIRTTQYT